MTHALSTAPASQRSRKCWTRLNPSALSTSEQSSSAESVSSPVVTGMCSPVASNNCLLSPAQDTHIADAAEAVQKALVSHIFRRRVNTAEQCRSCRHCPSARPSQAPAQVLGREVISTHDVSTCGSTCASEVPAWRRVVPRGSCPCSRFGHTALAYKGHLVVVFGGKGEEGCLNDLWVYDARAQQWQLETPRRESPMPPPRSGHAAIMSEDSLYVLGGGGTDENVDMLDLWCYAFDKREWRCVKADIPGCPVKGHTLQLLPEAHTGGRSNRDLLLCVGGLVRSAAPTPPSSSSTEVDEEAAATTTTTAPASVGTLIPSNSVLIGRLAAGKVRWSLLRTSGQAPCPRSFHVAEMVRGTTLLVVFGGRTTKTYYTAHAEDPDAVAALPREHRLGANVLLNDLHILNAATGVWQRIDSFANPPPPRSCAASVWAGGRLLIVGGGGRTCTGTNYELDTLGRRWSPVELANQPLASCPTVTPVDGKLVFFGGCAPDGRLRGDVLELPLLPVPVKASASEWLHRHVTDALLFAESPAAAGSAGKFTRRPGEGRVTLRTDTFVKPYTLDRHTPEPQFFTDLQRLQERADESDGIAPPPLQIARTIDSDGVVHISMQYNANSHLAQHNFADDFRPPVPTALPEAVAATAVGPARTVSKPPPRLPSPAPAAAAATLATHGPHGSPRTPWLGLAAHWGANGRASPASSLSTPLSRTASGTQRTFQTTGADARRRGVRSGWSNSSETSSPRSDDSIAYLETAIGLQDTAQVMPSATPAADRVMRVCALGLSPSTFDIRPPRPVELLLQALEGPNGAFLIHRLLGVAQLEYRMANNR